MMIGILVIYRKKSCKLIFFRSGHDFVVILFIFSYTSSKVKMKTMPFRSLLPQKYIKNLPLALHAREKLEFDL